MILVFDILLENINIHHYLYLKSCHYIFGETSVPQSDEAPIIQQLSCFLVLMLLSRPLCPSNLDSGYTTSATSTTTISTAAVDTPTTTTTTTSILITLGDVVIIMILIAVGDVGIITASRSNQQQQAYLL